MPTEPTEPSDASDDEPSIYLTHEQRVPLQHEVSRMFRFMLDNLAPPTTPKADDE